MINLNRNKPKNPIEPSNKDLQKENAQLAFELMTVQFRLEESELIQADLMFQLMMKGVI